LTNIIVVEYPTQEEWNTMPLERLIPLGESYPEAFMKSPLVRLHMATSPGWLFRLPIPTLYAVVSSLSACPLGAVNRLSRERELPMLARSAAAGRTSLTGEQFPRFLRHAARVRASLANNTSLPVELEAVLAEDKFARVRAGIARHTKNEDLLRTLGHDRSIYHVRAAVASNPAIPDDVIAYLSNSEVSQIQLSLVQIKLVRALRF
jgi:hypothetical protein